MNAMAEIPCNCYHVKGDHKIVAMFSYDQKILWCRYSEIGQCPCDRYTEMDNLEYLEWISSQR